jgi:hypothetical protein
VRRAELAPIDLPDFGPAGARPDLAASLYLERLAALRTRGDAVGYDCLVVYADREHSANLSYLTGFDPRFEEAILIVTPARDPLILVGNECYGMAGSAPLPLRRELFQDLSLPGQPRNRSRTGSDPHRPRRPLRAGPDRDQPSPHRGNDDARSGRRVHVHTCRESGAG